ncbi:TPA: ATP-binding cassette domain-containing protein [Streptococcus suis]
MTQLSFENVNFKDGDKTILQDINFHVNKGDYISIVGPSGSGKSTLLKLASDLISPTSGKISFEGKDYDTYAPEMLRQKIAYIFQTPYLFGQTVKDNVYYPYQVRHLRPDQDRIEQLFHQMEMSPSYLGQDIRKLSGGEKQRIALIRSLLLTPDILLLDEVTSALDSENTLIVERVIQEIHQEGTTILWVTHNLDQSRKYANRLMTVEGGRILSLEDL